MNSIRKHVHLYLIVIFISFFSKNLSYGQDIKLKHLSAKDGLSNNFVNCLLQDCMGFIWFGTDDGLNRFDGYETKVYRNNPEDSNSISGNIIWALFEDKGGYLWVGTKSGGLNKFDPVSEIFNSWILDSTATEEINITYITEDSTNNIWIGTYKHGVFQFNPSKYSFTQWANKSEEQQIISANFILSILKDNYSNVWVSTYYGLNKFNPESISKPFEIIDNKLFHEPLWYLTKSNFYENSIWIGKLNGLINFNPQSLETVQIDLPVAFGLQYGNSVSSVVEEEFAGEKILWVGTYGGLVRLNLNTGFDERFVQNKNSPSGILSNQINDLIIDESGVLWIATDNGLNYYSPKSVKFNLPLDRNASPLNHPDIKNGNIRTITQTSNNTLWFGAEKGLFGLQLKEDKSLVIKNSELEDLNVWSMENGVSDNLWIGTYGQGLKELNLRTNQIKPWKVENPDFQPSPYYYVKAIMQDKEGMVWIGFWGGGLARLNPTNGKVKYWRHNPEIHGSLSFNDIWAIHQDKKGRIWIGTNGGGLNLYDEATNGFTVWKSDKSTESFLSSNSVYTFYEPSHSGDSEDKTILWIGTSGGLNKFVICENSKYVSDSNLIIENTIYTVENGLPDNSIESILEDENGNLWIGTSSGISFFALASETFENFSSVDGLSRGASNSSAACKISGGLMLFGSTTGLNFFEPNKISRSKFSPNVVITDFQLFNQPEGNNKQFLIHGSITYAEEIVLSYDQNDFSFQFTSLDFNAPEDIKYAYQLEGFDEDWIYSGARRFVTYTNLDAGEYVFRVKATNSDGVWNDKEANLAIIIASPFWMTWWAYLIYGIVFLGSLYLIRDTELKRRQKKEEDRLRRERETSQLREAKLKTVTVEQEKELEKQKIRNRIAQDLHDEIGSNLSSISLMSELIQKDGKINTEAFEKIQRIQKVAKGSSQAMRDIVWLTNPSSDSIKDLISKMNEVANDMLGGLKWNFDFPRSTFDINLIPEVKRNVFFIFKESLNNILKHAKANNVNIDLKLVDSKILLKIEDDGNGFDTSTSSSGNGLKNLLSRAKEINGELNIKSVAKSGTIINLLVKITQVRD